MTTETSEFAGKPINYAYQLFMLFLCVYAISELAISTLVQLPREASRVLEIVDWAVCGLFLFDFGRQLVVAEDRFRYFYTWGWIDLLSSVPMVGGLRAGRVARALRILRVLRALRATRMLVTYVLKHRAESAFFSVLSVSFSMIVFSAVAILSFELDADGANIRSAEDALWWAVTTITTVGYGDRFPVTSEGRAIAAMLMTAGVGLFGTLSGIVAAWFLSPDDQEVAATIQERAEISDLKAAVGELRVLLDEARSNSRLSQ
jgi:voltage-gated potassium channel